MIRLKDSAESILKRISLILVLILFNNSGNKMEWYVEFYKDKNSIHRCSRDKYLEYKELLNYTKPNKVLDLNIYYCWENDYKNKFANLK